MRPEFHWFLPSSGDGHQLVHSGARSVRSGRIHARTIDPDYLRLVACTAEQAGFDGAMLPLNTNAVDPWLLAASLAADTQRLKLMVTFRPGTELPAHFARKAATLQKLSGGRLILNMISVGESPELRALGDFVPRPQRYERAIEFFTIARALWAGQALEHAGPHYLIGAPPAPEDAVTPPPIHIGGACEGSEPLVARHADLHTLWGEPPPMVAPRLARMRQRAAEAGRTLGFALRIHVIARATETQAWQEAQRLLDGIPPALVEVAQQQLAAAESVGQARMRALHGGRLVADARALEVYPNVWSGVGLVRGGAGTALVGSYDQVAKRIEEYAALGFTSFVLSGYPNLEEARVVGEQVLPRVRLEGDVG